MNLIAALPRIDLTDRDFSECVMPYAYLYKRDLTGSKNLRDFVFIITDYFFIANIAANIVKFIKFMLKVVLKIIYLKYLEKNSLI
jgi:hypothetical protein